jgi:hypothetical protein
LKTRSIVSNNNLSQNAGYTGDPSPEGSWSLIALRSSSILAMMVMNS